MGIISKRKIILKINPVLKNYLVSAERGLAMPVSYKELNDYEEAFPLENSLDENHWETIHYHPDKKDKINQSLIQTYALLKTEGNVSILKNLSIERIDHFIFGETKPFRVRIVNNQNKRFEYFYIKIADASRIYGLEFEHYLSQNRINYIVGKNTIVEEHISGIPGDIFVKVHHSDVKLDKTGLAKEFVKFNERCFIRLLGDMHPGNFVIGFTPDGENVHYSIRAIDFDQQSYEGKKYIYLPQTYKRNSTFLDLIALHLDQDSIKQYQIEERAILAKRIKRSYVQIKN